MVKNLRLFLLSMVAMLGVTSAFAEDIIWQEDWSDVTDFNADPASFNANYSFTGTVLKDDGTVKSGTKFYNEKLAGGEAPELLIAKSGGSFTAKIALNGKSGDMKLSFKTNKTLTVETANKDVVLGDADKSGNTYTLNVTVPAGTELLVLTFSNSTSSNARFDDVKLYQGTAKKPAGLSWGKASTTLTIGEEVTLVLSNENQLPVTYTSSEETVATISADGAITLIAAGKTTFTAAFAGNDEYDAQSVSIDVTVKAATTPEPEPQPQPVADTLTVAQALAIVEALEDEKTTTETYFVKGYVVGAPDFQRNNSGALYGNVNFTMADEKGGTTLLTVFRAKGFDNANFTEETISQLKENDVVVLNGKLQKYVKNNETTPELTSGHLVTVNGTTPQVEPVEVTTAANIGAFLALEAGAEAKLTLTNAQVTYVNVNNNKTDLFVRDATGAIDLYDLGIEATVGQLLNGTITVKLGANAGFVAAVKGTNELASTVVATAGGEVVAKTIDLAEAAAYYSDYVLLAGVTLNSEGKAENEDGDAVALYDRFQLGLIGGLKSDGTKYDIYGLMYDGGTQYGPELVVTKVTLAGGGEIVDDPVTFTGDGTQANPYTVADLLQLNPDKIANYIAADAQVWVKGVIITSIKNNALEEAPSQVTNIAIAAQAGETDYAVIVPVELKSGSQFRNKLNVVDNASNIGKEVLLCGNILKYFNKVGVKNLTDYVLDGQQLTTGINEVKTAERFQGAIYNVAGQRITTPAKGLYIMNGKKIVVK